MVNIMVNLISLFSIVSWVSSFWLVINPKVSLSVPPYLDVSSWTLEHNLNDIKQNLSGMIDTEGQTPSGSFSLTILWCLNNLKSLYLSSLFFYLFLLPFSKLSRDKGKGISCNKITSWRTQCYVHINVNCSLKEDARPA